MGVYTVVIDLGFSINPIPNVTIKFDYNGTGVAGALWGGRKDNSSSPPMTPCKEPHPLDTSVSQLTYFNSV